MEAKDTVMNFMRIEEIDAKNATSNFKDALVDVAREQAEISFKAGRREIATFVRPHLSKISGIISDIQGDWTDPRSSCREAHLIITEIENKLEER